MSYPPGGPPPYYGPPQHPPWPYPPPPPHGMSGHPPGPPGPPYPYYVPAMMVPMPYPQDQPQPTYITNYIYHGDTTVGPAAETPNPPQITDQVNVVECSGDFEWVPTTSTLASSLTGRAVVGGHEGWDGSPLWVIRAFYNGDLIPGKLSVRHNSATIAYNGKEVPVQNIEVLCCNPESLRWVPASNGNVPPGAIPGGVTASTEKVYVGRGRHQLSLTPGKVQQSLGGCYISLAGSEVALTMYDVLCRAS